MGCNFVLFLSLVIFAAATGKYVYVQHALNWPDAQQHCWDYYTDLASISNSYDINIIRSHGSLTELIWIGLMRTETKWMWSGGIEVSWFFWEAGEPIYNLLTEDYGAIRNYTSYARPGDNALPLFCYKVYPVTERKTWEEALQHCRQNYRDLASVASETEMMHIQRELRKQNSSEHVWIGFRFLDGDWRWVDSQPLEYEAWAPEGKPWCPPVNACAALQLVGAKWQFPANDEGLVLAENVTVWNARDCTERLHFLCY